MARSIAFPTDGNYQSLSGNIDPAIDGVTYHNFGAGFDYTVKLPDPASVAVRQGYSFGIVCANSAKIIQVLQAALQKIRFQGQSTQVGAAGYLEVNYGAAIVVTYFGSDQWICTSITYPGGTSVV